MLSSMNIKLRQAGSFHHFDKRQLGRHGLSIESEAVPGNDLHVIMCPSLHHFSEPVPG
jgi:hypothetical protein